jgi:hypothetical protein
MHEEFDEEIAQTMQAMLEKLEEIKLSILMMQYSMKISGRTTEPDHVSVQREGSTDEESVDRRSEDTTELNHPAAADLNLDEEVDIPIDIDSQHMTGSMTIHQSSNIE